MFKKIIIGILVLGLSFPQIIFATSSQKNIYDSQGTYVGYSKIWSDKDSALANGSEIIKINGGVWIVSTECPSAPCYWPPGGGHKYRILVSGSGNSISPSEITSGDVIFQLSSTVADTKTITLQNWQMTDWATDASIQITFTSATQPKSTTTTTSAPATVQKPSAPAISAINGNALSENKTYNKTLRQGQKITFSGKTSVNSTVKLYIYSDPITAEVKSDKDGNWLYTLTQDLAIGEHRVEAEVTDANSQKSDKVEIAKFTIKPKIETPASTSTNIPTFIFSTLTYGLFGLVLVLMGILIYLIIKRKKKVGNSNIPSNPVV
ncbi:MAG TPA: Ig-like domain-containing protein [Patescibacteria group bacterium]|nr:Ig-like domain-containing protein [Patescibacteria group bacterium]